MKLAVIAGDGIGPEVCAAAVEAIGLPKVIPVHFDDYGVFASPLRDFREEMGRRGMGERIVEIPRGESVSI